MDIVNSAGNKRGLNPKKLVYQHYREMFNWELFRESIQTKLAVDKMTQEQFSAKFRASNSKMSYLLGANPKFTEVTLHFTFVMEVCRWAGIDPFALLLPEKESDDGSASSS